MDAEKLVKYLKSLNPKPHEQGLLFFGRKYHLYNDEKYMGVFTWVEDDDCGNSFQQNCGVDDEGFEKIIVGIGATRWELIPGSAATQNKEL